MTTGGHHQGRLLWLVRHAKAVADPPPGGADHERPLAPRGRRDAAALGHRLGAGDLGVDAQAPEYVVCSTATRTTETAERAGAALGIAVDRRRRLYYGSPGDVLAELRTVDDDYGSVMVVGHNPAAHFLALELLTDDTVGREQLASFPTCALAVIRLAAGRWQDVVMASGTLVGFFTPPYTAA